MAQTAIAPANMRPLAPANSTYGSKGTMSGSRPLKPLLPNTRYRPLSTASTVSSTSLASSPPSMAARNEVCASTPLQRSDSVASGSSTTSFASSSNPSPTIPAKQDVDNMLPKRDWVLPARAKPGRKPSDVEPPTKRKAQNRASQRAFRERKQSYVSSLEEKIEEYEKREAGLSMELQKMARRLKEENEELKRDNQKLKESLHKMKTEQMKQHNQQKNEPVFMPRNETLPLSTTSGMWNHWSDQSWNDSNKKESKSNSNSVAMNRDCGFCTEQSPCVCSGEGVLDLTQDESHLSTKMAPLKEGIDDHDKEMESPRKLPLARPLSTSLLAPQRIASKGKKLWYTIPNAFPVTICPTETKSSLASHNTKLLLPPPLQSLTRPKSKLWPVYSPLPNSALHQEGQSVPIYRLQKTMNGGNGSNGSGIEAACSGDPANCNACSTDPALAAFCRVVASHLSSDVNQQGKVKLALLDAGNALPLRNHRKRNHDGVQLLSSSFPTSPINNKNQSIGLNLYTNKTVDDSMQNQKVDSTDIKQTIPEAWQRIKQHPSFPSWQGGLNLLADVVSKRVDQMSSSSSSSSPLEEPPIPRVGIEKHSSVAMKFHLRSNDRKLDKEGFDKGQETSSKRRKLYVDNKSVEDALALLDRGFIKTKEKYCVCPLNRDL